MTNETDDRLDGILGLAIEELTKLNQSDMDDDASPPDGLNELVLGKITDAKSTSSRDIQELAPAIPQNSSRKKSVMFAKLIVAASLLVAVVGTAVLGVWGGNTSLYAQVAERMQGLQSLICRVQVIDENALVDVHGSNGEKLTYQAPSFYHVHDEWLETIEIINGESGEYLMLNQESKEALVMKGHVVDTLLADSSIQLLEAVHQHFRVNRKSQADVKELGDRTIDGKRAMGLRSTIGGETVEAWFDSESLLPALVRVRLEIPAHLSGGSKQRFWRVLSDFQFNVPVDSELFSQEIPEGYRPVEFDSPFVDASPATLDDLLEMLRICAEANDLEFPRSLTFNNEEGSPLGIQGSFAEQFDQQLDSGDETQQAAAIRAVSDFGVTVARGSVFLLGLNDTNRVRYFGGARLNDTDRPVLWYSPEANDQFKIVYADLTVKDATAEGLPPEPAPVAKLSTESSELDDRSVHVSTPRFELPRSAVSDYAKLQEIRTAGKQQEVEYLDLGWMPEFIESPISRTRAGELQEVPEDWKPELGRNTNRLAFLREFTNLKGLVACTYLTQRDLDSIASCKSLARLSLYCCQIVEAEPRQVSGDDLKKLAGLSRLESLDLSQSHFAGGLQHLSDLPRLHTLFLSSFQGLSDRTLAELKVLSRLETLVLAPVYLEGSKQSVTDVGLQSLQQLPNLKTLYVGYHGEYTMPVDRLRELLPNVDVKAPLDGVQN